MHGCSGKQHNEFGAKIMEVPVIVISSSSAGAGKTTLALNLAAALWSDSYKVRLFAPHNETVRQFMAQRRILRTQRGTDLPLPELIDDISELSVADDKTVVIADIPAQGAEHYAEVFAKAHTLITVGKSAADFEWPLTHPYINLIWEAKKSIAARGIKYLNWIAVLNQTTEDTESIKQTMAAATKRFGFRVAEPLHDREAFRYIENGYCAADMANFRKLFKMSMSDVYARREILTLTDFLWQK